MAGMRTSTQFLVCGLVLIFGVGIAVACVCRPKPDPRAAMEASDFVFAGEPIRVVDEIVKPTRVHPDIEESETSGDLVGWLVAVDTIWKGAIADTLVIYSPRTTVSCGYPFNCGEKYLVYGNRMRPARRERFGLDPGWPDILETGMCSRTEEFGLADLDLRELPAPIWQR